MSNSLTLPDLIGAPVDRQAVLDRIHSDPALSDCFCHFTKKEQSELLSFIEGNRGIRITYDPIFRKIFDPDACPERLEDMLSSILKQKVSILKLLPNEGIQLSEEGSFVIMDIIVQLEDGSIITIEMQKIGYDFPSASLSTLQGTVPGSHTVP